MAGSSIQNRVQLGDSSTDANNFELKTNYDGTLSLKRGAFGTLDTIFGVDSSGNLTGKTQLATDNSTKLSTTAFSRSISMGIGQTWQDLTGSRATGTPYTNNTGKAITVSVWGMNGSAGTSISFVINGIRITNYSAGDNSFMTASVVVPAGDTYHLTVYAGTFTVSVWAEMR